MGTIADKRVYLDDTKTALRKAINDAGGYLTVDSTSPQHSTLSTAR